MDRDSVEDSQLAPTNYTFPHQTSNLALHDSVAAFCRRKTTHALKIEQNDRFWSEQDAVKLIAKVLSSKSSIVCSSDAQGNESLHPGLSFREIRNLCRLHHLTFARASSALPSSTNASSMTGSSKNEASDPRLGISEESTPTENDAVQPSATRLFMLGLPAPSDRKPSFRSLWWHNPEVRDQALIFF